MSVSDRAHYGCHDAKSVASDKIITEAAFRNRRNLYASSGPKASPSPTIPGAINDNDSMPQQRTRLEDGSPSDDENNRTDE
jgi:hypothetical protein